MSRDLTAVSPETAMVEAAKTMARQRLEGLPVVDEEYRVIGFISEADIIRSIIPSISTGGEEFLAPVDFVDLARKMSQVGERTVRDYMNEKVVTVTEEDDIYRLCELMLARGYKTLPVVKEGRLEGVVHRTDVSSALMEQREAEKKKGE